MIGGDNANQLLKRIIHSLFTQEILMKFNRTGSNGKLPFKEHIESNLKGMSDIKIVIILIINHYELNFRNC